MSVPARATKQLADPFRMRPRSREALRPPLLYVLCVLHEVWYSTSAIRCALVAAAVIFAADHLAILGSLILRRGSSIATSCIHLDERQLRGHVWVIDKTGLQS